MQEGAVAKGRKKTAAKGAVALPVAAKKKKTEAPVAKGGRKKPAGKGAGPAKKKKKTEEPSDESDVDEEVEEEEDEDGSDGNKSDSSQGKDVPKHFHSGNFVLLKTDVKWDGDTVTSKASEINLWKIDCKALLQKYIHFEENGKTLHKCSTVYSGWNSDHRDKYYSVTEILNKNPKTAEKQPCVEIDLAELIKVKNKE